MRKVTMFALPILILTVLFCFKLCYVPARQITVKDPFGNPIPKILIKVQDRTETPGLGDSLSKVLGTSYSVTDADGIANIHPKFYFDFPYLFTYLSVNEHYATYLTGEVQYQYDGKIISVHKEKTHDITLAPIKIDVDSCLTIEDKNLKLECLTYAPFFTAVRDNNPELCSIYASQEMLNFLGESKVYNVWYRRSETGWLIFVDGILNNNPDVCDKMVRSSDYYDKPANIADDSDHMRAGYSDLLYKKDQQYKENCVRTFKPLSCDDIAIDSDEYERCLFMENPDFYLCQYLGNRPDWEGGYINPYISHIRISWLYKYMFCN